VKVFNQENGFLVFQKIFGGLMTNNIPFVIWQLDSGINKRYIFESKLNTFSLEKKILNFGPFDTQMLQLSLAVYCYSEEAQVIFKTTLKEIRETSFSLVLPKEITLLEDEERDKVLVQIGINLNSYQTRLKRMNFGIPELTYEVGAKIKSMAQRTSRDQDLLLHEFGPISVDDEDALFASKRESPRARPKNEKWVVVKLADTNKMYRFKLFDLSQGGMGFITIDQTAFTSGTTIYLLGIDQNLLDDPLIGKVMSQRPMDQTEIEWKIGVKFDDGQS